MRPLWKDILAAVWLGIIIPGIVLNAFVLKDRIQKNQLAMDVRQQEIPRKSHYVLVRDPDGIYREMELDKYVTGVLLGEIPADFHPEALKAQSVAARTFTWKACVNGGKHGDHSVCTDSACCQAYLSEESYLSRGGTQENLEKVRKAVEATSSFVLMYDEGLIEATYFSSSGGSTEAALAVWGADFPYLQAVSSPEPVDSDTARYTLTDFQQRLGKSFSGNPDEWIGTITYTEGGGIETMEICGDVYTGVEMRSLLGLRSTAFQIAFDGENVLITTRGYGHRVGMSQYGANTMAEAGSTWQQILQHYYPGTVMVPI